MEKYGYIRVSTNKQDMERQERSLYNILIPSNNIYKDACSGTTHVMERPGFRQMIADIPNGSTIYIDAVDRLARDMFVGQECFDILANKSIIIGIISHVDVKKLGKDELNTFDSADRALLDKRLEFAVDEYEMQKYRREQDGVVSGRHKKPLPKDWIAIVLSCLENEITVAEATKRIGYKSKTSYYANNFHKLQPAITYERVI